MNFRLENTKSICIHQIKNRFFAGRHLAQKHFFGGEEKNCLFSRKNKQKTYWNWKRNFGLENTKSICIHQIKNRFFAGRHLAQKHFFGGEAAEKKKSPF